MVFTSQLTDCSTVLRMMCGCPRVHVETSSSWEHCEAALDLHRSIPAPVMNSNGENLPACSFIFVWAVAWEMSSKSCFLGVSVPVREGCARIVVLIIGSLMKRVAGHAFGQLVPIHASWTWVDDGKQHPYRGGDDKYPAPRVSP